MFQKKIVFLFILVNLNSLKAENVIDSLLIQLDKELSNQTLYDESKEIRIKEFKKLLSEKSISFENGFFLRKKIIKEYGYYKLDSALYYIEENLFLAKKNKSVSFVNESKLDLAMLLASSGSFLESIGVLKNIDISSFKHDNLVKYYFIYRKCYKELNLFSKLKMNKVVYQNLYYAYKDSLDIEVSKLKTNSLFYLTEKEEKYRAVGEFKKAIEINQQNLSLVNSGTREYSMVAYQRSYTNAALYGDSSLEYKKYLILSALSDIKGSVKDNAALTDLAVSLYKEGYIDKANKYINFSFEDANFYNSQLRSVQLSKIFPVISKSYEERGIVQKRKLKTSLIFISVLSIILFAALAYIFSQFKKLMNAKNELKNVNKELQDLNHKLIDTNKDLTRLYNELSASDRIKEHYVGTFLNLYSEYISKLDMYRKTVRKYLSTNKINTLLELTKSKQVIDTELKLFYSNFDESFLHIYPNFIKDFNALLQEDKQIVLKKGELLNTELRIFALVRLGITNSSKISKILRYSVNTIYNYRVKVKNSAINRDQFEELLREIS